MCISLLLQFGTAWRWCSCSTRRWIGLCRYTNRIFSQWRCFSDSHCWRYLTLLEFPSEDTDNIALFKISKRKVSWMNVKLMFQKEFCLLIDCIFFFSRITYIHLPVASKWLYVGTEKGNIHVVHTESFTLSGYIINWNKTIEL